MVEKDATSKNAKVIAPRMFKIDLEPLSPKVLKNRDAHIDYIKHSQEHADILREIIEYTRALRPLVSDLDSLYKYIQRIQEVLAYVTARCPSLSKPRKRKKHTYTPKAEDPIQEKLYLLHMDLCGPLRLQSINGQKYILVIVDDYSWFTWVKFLRLKDEVLEFMIKFFKMIQVCLNATVQNIRTDNGTEFVNQTLIAYFEDVRISHQTSVACSPQQNDAEAVATACYTENQSLICKRHNKTPYELLHDNKPDLSYLRVFGALCYPTNDSEDLGKLKPKADIKIFVGYAPTKKAYQIYNKRTRLIIETPHVDFDELIAMDFEQFSLGPEP
nr:integrase, catalytic region, zinc finger, CCHC-type, peptidase aspartic, catalytic [Tanacetum cinerariifolium]